MNRLDAMEVLLQVVAQGNLSAAGRKLGLPLTTVSRRIADLEAHLGARLLVRSNRSVTLTDAGQSYIEACKRILTQVAEAEAAASGAFTAARGEMTVTAPMVFGRLHVLPVLTDFLVAYPEIDLRLSLADRLLHLQDDHVDLAIRIGTLPPSSLKAVRLGAVRRVVCASPAYIQSQGIPATPLDLARHACISFTGLGVPDRWAFAGPDGGQTVSVTPRLTVTTAEAALDAAIAGLGLTRVLSYQAASAQAAGLLQVVLAGWEQEAIPVSMLYDGQGALPLKLRALLDYTGPRLKRRLSALQI